MFKLISQPLYANGSKEAWFIIRWFAVSLLLHSIIAYFSIGFYHPDEHFQLLEFGGLKAGYTTPSDLPWEYSAHIRPAFQPFIVYLIIKTIAFFGTTDPFLVATILRFISAILGWASTALVTIAALQWFPATWLRKSFVIFSSVLGGLIFIHVRFSSESWSGSFAFMAIGLLILLLNRNESLKAIKSNPVLLVSGLLLGLSYICRFQSLFLFPGLFLWLLFIGKVPVKNLLIICTGIAISIIIGVLIDRWFYGQWVNTLYDYYVKNIVEGRAAQFGVAPWWWYFPALFKYGLFAFQSLMIFCILISFIRSWRNIMVWACVPFLLAHIMVSHKELRFLFPIADALPVLVALGIWGLHLENAKASIHKVISIIVLTIGIIFIFLNTGILFNLCKYPPQPYVDPMYAIYLTHKEPVDVIINDRYVNMMINGGLKMNFYKRPNTHFIYIMNPDSLKILIDKDPKMVLLMVNNRGFQLDKMFSASKPYLIPEYYQMPLWIKGLDMNHWEDRTSSWQVYRAVRPLR